MNVRLFQDIAYGNARGCRAKEWMKEHWDEWIELCDGDAQLAKSVAAQTIWCLGFEGSIDRKSKTGRWVAGNGQRSRPSEEKYTRVFQTVQTEIGPVSVWAFKFNQWLAQFLLES